MLWKFDCFSSCLFIVEFVFDVFFTIHDPKCRRPAARWPVRPGLGPRTPHPNDFLASESLTEAKP